MNSPSPPRFSNPSEALVFSYVDGDVKQHQVVPEEVTLKVRAVVMVRDLGLEEFHVQELPCPD